MSWRRSGTGEEADAVDVEYDDAASGSEVEHDSARSLSSIASDDPDGLDILANLPAQPAPFEF